MSVQSDEKKELENKRKQKRNAFYEKMLKDLERYKKLQKQ